MEPVSPAQTTKSPFRSDVRENVEKARSMVFQELPMSVEIGADVIFRFSAPISIISLCVVNEQEEELWDLIADVYKPALASEGGPIEEVSAQIWPIAEAPPVLLDMLAQIEEREDRRLREEGPRTAPIGEVVYGQLPAGYRETRAARPLTPGEYAVLVFGEQGQAHARFTIAGTS